MDIKKLEIAINQLERVHRDMNDCANRFILKDAIDQLQEQVKLFAIPVVNGSFTEWYGKGFKDGLNSRSLKYKRLK